MKRLRKQGLARLVLAGLSAASLQAEGAGGDSAAALQPAQNRAGEQAASASRLCSRGMRTIADMRLRRVHTDSARLTLVLPEGSTASVHARGSKGIVVTLPCLRLPPKWLHSMALGDFKTVLKTMQPRWQAEQTLLQLQARVPVRFNTHRKGLRFVVTIRRARYAATLDTRKPVTLTLQDAEACTTLQNLANMAGVNMVISTAVKSRLTLSLHETPWQQALDVVLFAAGLARRMMGDIMYIAPAEEIAAYEKAEQERHQAAEAREALTLVNLPLNYAEAEEVAAAIQQRKRGLVSARGSVSVDKRTNTVIVQDTASALARIRELVTTLDAPMRQVLIQARVVEVNRDALEELGLRVYAGSGGVPFTFGRSIAGQIKGADDGSGSGTPGPRAGGQGRSGAGLLLLNFSRLSGTVDLNLELSALESEARAKKLSNPHLLVADNREAFIKQGKDIPYQERTYSGGTSIAFRQAVLELLVRPRIAPNNRITLFVSVKKDEAGADVAGSNAPVIMTREIRTRLLVKNGETVVLGGIYENEHSNLVHKLPWFSNLPLIGQVFRYTRYELVDRELLIFLTTSIVEPENGATVL